MPHLARRTCCAAVAALTWLAFAPALAQGVDRAAHRLLIQVSDNDPQKWNLALNNARNVQETTSAAPTPPSSRSWPMVLASAC